MILTSLKARDFLQFSRLTLDDLPGDGLICIRGPNEAGKTSLGEAISFALFGRTLRLDESRRGDAIRWGQESTEVVAEFTVGDQGYRITRSMDTAGGYGAKLERRLGAGVEVLAEGPVAVEAALPTLVGFDFEAFRYAFYLGQKEIDLLLDSAEEGGALERMTGVRDLEAARARAIEEARDLEEGARESALRIRLQSELMEELSRGGAELDETKTEVTRSRDELAAVRDRIAEYEAADEGASELAAASAAVGALLDRIQVLTLLRSLSGRITELDRKAEALRDEAKAARKAEEEALELQREHRMFADSLGELEQFVKAKGAEIAGTGGARPRRAAKDAPKVESETERLQRMAREREAQLDREKRLHDDLELSTGTSGKWLGAGVAVGPLMALVQGDPRWFLTLPVAGMAFLILRAQRDRAADAAARIARGQDDLTALQAELGEVRKVGKACDRFQVRNKATLLEGLKAIGSDSLLRMAERLEERFPKFWNAPETFLEGYSGVLQEAVEQRRGAFDAAIEASREAASAAAASRLRLEALVTRGGFSKPLSQPFEDVETDGLEAAVATDLGVAEARLTAWEARGLDPKDLPQNRGEIRKVFDLLDPGGDLERPDSEGFFRVLRGNEPPGLSRGQDPWPWAAAQAAKGAAFVREVGAAGDGPELAEARRLAARLEVTVELLERRRAKLEAGASGAPPEERIGHIAELEATRTQQVDQARIRRVLADCLGATITRIRTRLFPGIAAYAARLLPRVTGGRHGEVRISTAGELQVFAPEAGEYVGLDALSGGARDQLLLALRLAFASAVVRARSTQGAGHFLFLDEPLASSDEARGQAFMDLLQDRAEAFPQVFVVTHRSGGEGDFAKVLELALDEISEAGGADAAEAAEADEAGEAAGAPAEPPAETAGPDAVDTPDDARTGAPPPDLVEDRERAGDLPPAGDADPAAEPDPTAESEPPGAADETGASGEAGAADPAESSAPPPPAEDAPPAAAHP